MQHMTYDYQLVGNRIRSRRKELGLTRDALAERMGRAPKYCADIERGTCGMSIETLLLFCRALELSPNTLLLGAATPDEAGTIEQQILSGLRECTPEQKQSILQMIRLFTQR